MSHSRDISEDSSLETSSSSSNSKSTSSAAQRRSSSSTSDSSYRRAASSRGTRRSTSSRSTSPSTHSSRTILSVSSAAVPQGASPLSFSFPLRSNSVENATGTSQHEEKPEGSTDKGDTVAEEDTLRGGQTVPDRKESEPWAVQKEPPQREGTALHMGAPQEGTPPSPSLGSAGEEKKGAPPSFQTAANGNASLFSASSTGTSSGEHHSVTPHQTPLVGVRGGDDGIVAGSLGRLAIFTKIDSTVEEPLPRPSTPSSFSGNTDTDNSDPESNNQLKSTSHGKDESNRPTQPSESGSFGSLLVASDHPPLGTVSRVEKDGTSSSKGDIHDSDAKAPARSVLVKADPLRKSTLVVPPPPLPVPSMLQRTPTIPGVVPPSAVPPPPPRTSPTSVTFLEPHEADEHITHREGSLAQTEAKGKEEIPSRTSSDAAVGVAPNDTKAEEKISTLGQQQEDSLSSMPVEYEDDYEEEDEEEEEKEKKNTPVSAQQDSTVSHPHDPHGSHSTEDNEDEESFYSDPFFSDRRRRAARASQSSGFQRLGHFVAFGDARSERGSAKFSNQSADDTHSTFIAPIYPDSGGAPPLEADTAERRTPFNGSPSLASWSGAKPSSHMTNEEETKDHHHTSAAGGHSSFPVDSHHEMENEGPKGVEGGGEGEAGKMKREPPLPSTTPTTSSSPTGKAEPKETDDSSSIFSTLSAYLGVTPGTGRLPAQTLVTPLPLEVEAPHSTAPPHDASRSPESSNFSSVSAAEHRPHVSPSHMAWAIDGSDAVPGGTNGVGVTISSSWTSDAASPSLSFPTSSHPMPASFPSSSLMGHTAGKGGVVRTIPVLTAPSTGVIPPATSGGASEGTSSRFAATASYPSPLLSSTRGKAPPSSSSSLPTTIGSAEGLSTVPLPKPSFFSKTDEASRTTTTTTAAVAAAPQAQTQQREWRLEELRETSKAVERLVGAFAGLKVGYTAPASLLPTYPSSSTFPPPPPPRRLVVQHHPQTSMHTVGGWDTQKTFPLPSRRPYPSLGASPGVVGVSADLLATPMTVLHPSYPWRCAAESNAAMHVPASPPLTTERIPQSLGTDRMPCLPGPCNANRRNEKETVVEAMIREVVGRMLQARAMRKDNDIAGGPDLPSEGNPWAFGRKDDAARRSRCAPPHVVVSSEDFRMDGRPRERDGLGFPHRLHSSRVPLQRGNAVSYSGRERLPFYGSGGRPYRPAYTAENALQAFSLFSGTPDDDADADHALQQAITIALEKYFWSRVLPSCSASLSTLLPPPSSVASLHTRGTATSMSRQKERAFTREGKSVAGPDDLANGNGRGAMPGSFSPSSSLCASPLASLAPLISPYVAWVMLLDIIGVCRDIIEYGLLLDRGGDTYHHSMSGMTTNSRDPPSPPVSCSFFGCPVLVQFTGPADMEELARATMHCLPFEALETATSAASPLYTAAMEEDGHTRVATCTSAFHTPARTVFRLEYWVSRERLFSVIEAVESSLRTHLVHDAQGVPLLLLPHAHRRQYGSSSAAAKVTPALVLEGDEKEGGGGGTLEESLCMPNGVIPTKASYFMVLPPSSSRSPLPTHVPSRQYPRPTEEDGSGSRRASPSEAESTCCPPPGVREDPPLLPRQGRAWKRKTLHFLAEAEKEEQEHLFGIGEDAVERISHVVSCLATDILTQSEVHHPHRVTCHSSTENTSLDARSTSLAYAPQGRKEETQEGESSSAGTLPLPFSPPPPPRMHLEKPSDFPLLCRIVAETTADLFEDVQVRRALERRAAEKLKEYYALKGTYATSSRIDKEKMWIQKAEEEANHTVNRILQEIRVQKVAEARAVYAA